MTDDTYDAIWEHCHQQITKGEVKHLIVLSSVPIAYPRLVSGTRIAQLRRVEANFPIRHWWKISLTTV